MSEPSAPNADATAAAASQQDEPEPSAALETTSQRKLGPTRITVALAAGALVAGGFLGGWYVGDHADDGPQSASGQLGPGLTQGLPGGFGPPRMLPANVLSGTVTSVDGDTVTITTQDGREVTVSTDDDTSVTLSEEGSVSDLSAGDDVIVTGDPNDDGSIDADVITEGESPFATRLGGGPAT